jgi:hypothetical protein
MLCGMWSDGIIIIMMIARSIEKIKDRISSSIRWRNIWKRRSHCSDGY